MFLANIKFLIAVRYVPTKIAIICYVGILKKKSEVSGHAAFWTFSLCGRLDLTRGGSRILSEPYPVHKYIDVCQYVDHSGG